MWPGSTGGSQTLASTTVFALLLNIWSPSIHTMRHPWRLPWAGRVNNAQSESSTSFSPVNNRAIHFQGQDIAPTKKQHYIHLVVGILRTKLSLLPFALQPLDVPNWIIAENTYKTMIWIQPFHILTPDSSLTSSDISHMLCQFAGLFDLLIKAGNMTSLTSRVTNLTAPLKHVVKSCCTLFCSM